VSGARRACRPPRHLPGLTGEPSGSHIQSIEVQQHVSGVGETTGDRYVSTFVNLFNYNDRFGEPPITSTQEVVFRITGPGPARSACPPSPELRA
jgi:hypothetical protein